MRWVTDNPAMVGGIDADGTPIVVQVDETKYFHRKYARGLWRDGHWVVGVVERDNSKNAFLIEVPNRSANTLLPIIQNHVQLGSMIHSDQWAAYNNIENLPQGYAHMTVNHSQNFVHPDTGVHTQGIESFWSHAKKKLKRMNGTKRELFDSYLKEFEWRWRRDTFPSGEGQAFQKILESITQQYPL